MKRHVIVGLCGIALLLAAVSVGSGQVAPNRGRAAESAPASGPGTDRTFRLRVYKHGAPKEAVFEKTFDAPAKDKGALLPKELLGQATAVLYDIVIDWPENPPPMKLAIQSYDYQVSRMTQPLKGKNPPKNKLYLGKSRYQCLALKNAKEGDDLIQEAVDLTVKDVRFRMSCWEEMLKQKK